jgi:hypothetical protein
MWVKLWIKSNRGTDESEIKLLPDDYDEETLKDYTEGWCSQFGAWNHGDNHVRYGFERLKKVPKKVRDELVKKLDGEIAALTRHRGKLMKAPVE